MRVLSAVQCQLFPDCAAMRRLAYGLLRARPLPLSSPPCSLVSSSRRLHGSAVRLRDENSSGIVPESLQKTLEAHRASNRASLIRMVPSGPQEGDGHSKAQLRSKVNPRLSGKLASPEAPVSKATSSRNSTTPTHRVSSTRPARFGSSKERERSGKWVYQLRWGMGLVKGVPQQYQWLNHYPNDVRQSDALAHLDAEIRALESYLTPNQHEQDRVSLLTRSVGDALANVGPEPPQVIGSWRTGLAVCHSGLDFVLPVPDVERSRSQGNRIRNPSASRPQNLEAYHGLLRVVGRTLRRTKLFGKVNMPSTRSPILTANHIPTGLQVQFVCREGPPPLIEYIEDYLAEYPSIRPLYRTVRLLLDAHRLFGPLCSSLTSTALLMLVVAFSKMNHGRFQRPDSLGEQLLAFLQTYGTTVDLTKTGVAVDPPGWFNHETLQEQLDELRSSSSSIEEELDIPAHLRGRRALINIKRNAANRLNVPTAEHLCIQDPTNYMNDLGLSCTRTRDLQQVWMDAHERLRIAMGEWESVKPDRSTSVLSHGLQVSLDGFQRRRAHLAEKKI